MAPLGDIEPDRARDPRPTDTPIELSMGRAPLPTRPRHTHPTRSGRRIAEATEDIATPNAWPASTSKESEVR